MKTMVKLMLVLVTICLLNLVVAACGDSSAVSVEVANTAANAITNSPQPPSPNSVVTPTQAPSPTNTIAQVVTAAPTQSPSPTPTPSNSKDQVVGNKVAILPSSRMIGYKNDKKQNGIKPITNNYDETIYFATLEKPAAIKDFYSNKAKEKALTYISEERATSFGSDDIKDKLVTGFIYDFSNYDTKITSDEVKTLQTTKDLETLSVAIYGPMDTSAIAVLKKIDVREEIENEINTGEYLVYIYHTYGQIVNVAATIPTPTTGNQFSKEQVIGNELPAPPSSRKLLYEGNNRQIGAKSTETFYDETVWFATSEKPSVIKDFYINNTKGKNLLYRSGVEDTLLGRVVSSNGKDTGADLTGFSYKFGNFDLYNIKDYKNSKIKTLLQNKDLESLQVSVYGPLDEKAAAYVNQSILNYLEGDVSVGEYVVKIDYTYLHLDKGTDSSTSK